MSKTIGGRNAITTMGYQFSDRKKCSRYRFIGIADTFGFKLSVVKFFVPV